MEEAFHGEGIEKSREKHCSNHEPNLSSKLVEIYKNWSSQTVPRMIFFGLNQSIFLFLSFEPTLFVVQLILAQFSNTLSINSLFLAFWDLSPSIFWVREPNLVLIVNYSCLFLFIYFYYFLIFVITKLDNN